MNYKYWLKTRNVILLFLSLMVISMETMNAQTNSPSITEIQSTPTPSNTSGKVVKPKHPKSTWEAILQLFFKNPKNSHGGSRGAICVLSPGILDSRHQIWNTQPFFVWEGIDTPFEIRLYISSSPEQERKLLWQQTISQASLEKTLPLIYTGPALEPNQSYDWELSISDLQTYLYKFRVMASPEREHLKADLQALETKLKSTKLTLEEMSLERVNFFAQRNLWSDALREIYAVKNPSPEMVNKKQELVNLICQ